MVQQKFGELFSHAFGQRCYQNAFAAVAAGKNFVKQIVNLVFGRPHLYLRIEKPCRSYKLLDNNAFGFL